VTATLIDGKAIAAALRDEIADQVAMLPAPPGLATVLVGDDPASAVYVASKRKQCTAAGMRDLHRHLPGDIGQADLAAVLDELAVDDAVHGILLQLPLPGHLDPAPLLARIPPAKDVDGRGVGSDRVVGT
jgi:methylenetetrahydrofolate dehydrogenase (NADP+) / methenyltetrahydrofolate cyclohydrolase